jgi:hypothetical protein
MVSIKLQVIADGTLGKLKFITTWMLVDERTLK